MHQAVHKRATGLITEDQGWPVRQASNRLTLLLLLSNSVQNAMTGPDTSLLGGAVAAGTLLILNYLVADVAGLSLALPKVG